MKLLIEESVLRQALETFTHCYAETDRRINERAKILVELRSALDAAENVEMLDAARAECEEQARLNGMGAEREAALLAKVEMLERELAATQHVVAQFSEGERKLRDELAAKTKELALVEARMSHEADQSAVKAERAELVAGITRMIGRFDRFEVPFTLAELRRQVAALAKVGAVDALKGGG